MSYVKYLRDVLGEGFKEFVIKFSDQDENINAYVEKFKLLKTRNKIKGVEADIDYWIKKDFGSFKTYVDKFVESELKSRKEVKKEAYKNMVAENEEYVIIKINNADEMYALGKGTVWCVASGEKEQAKSYYEHYTKDSNFYIAIKKNLGEISKLEVNREAVAIDEESDGKKYSNVYPYWDKIAIQVEKKSVTYWNTGDFNYSDDSAELSKINLPEYKFEHVFNVPRNWKLNEDGTYDVEGDVTITNDMVVDGKFPFKFNSVSANFYCQYCTSLVSLEGAPESVGAKFDCYECKSLVSLKGAPKSVGGSFNCYDCTSLSSLEGAPKSVGANFYCQYCTSLVSLEGAPKSVGGSFNCYGCKSLVSLEGAPKSVGGSFNCYECISLVSLEGAPESVGANFYCSGCPKLKLSELDKIPLSYKDKVKHDLKESTFYYWNKTYNKSNTKYYKS